MESGALQRVELFFHPVQIQGQLGSNPIPAIQQWFHNNVWPWPAKPQAYIDSRLPADSPEHCFQHAKVVIADADTVRAAALVTSANFSETAQRHNFEAGWLVREPWQANQVNDHLQRLVAEGFFTPI